MRQQLKALTLIALLAGPIAAARYVPRVVHAGAARPRSSGRVERAADDKFLHKFCTLLFRKFHRLVHAINRAGDHNLSGRIEICRLHNAGGRCICTYLLNRIRVQSNNSSHCSFVRFAGALHDPLAALVFCTPPKVDLSVINGVVRVKDGEIVGLDMPALVKRHNEISRKMLRDE